jgi:hypothetical protein
VITVFKEKGANSAPISSMPFRTCHPYLQIRLRAAGDSFFFHHYLLAHCCNLALAVASEHAHTRRVRMQHTRDGAQAGLGTTGSTAPLADPAGGAGDVFFNLSAVGGMDRLLQLEGAKVGRGVRSSQ